MSQEARSATFSLAARQHGVFTTAQAVGAGVSRRDLYRWRDGGQIDQAAPGVWLVRGAPDTPERSAITAVLSRGAGAALARSSAAWFWGIPGHQLEPLHVLRPRTDQAGNIGSHHTSRSLDSCDLTVRRSVVLTTPLRTLFDLAGRQHPLRTRRDLNHLMTTGLLTLERLDEGLSRLASRGRPGITVMRLLIAEQHEKGAPVGSSLELLAEEVLGGAGFHGLERQVSLGDDDGFVARVDLVHRPTKSAFEIDSDRFHGGLVDRMIDEDKTERLARAGWQVIRITEHELWWARDQLFARLRALRQRSTSRDQAAS
jgi:hypothetical protein